MPPKNRAANFGDRERADKAIHAPALCWGPEMSKGRASIWQKSSAVIIPWRREGIALIGDMRRQGK
jgi:hypothetical protein